MTNRIIKLLKRKKMKALNEMTNVNKGHLLAGLFPNQLKEFFDFIKQETEYFRGEEVSFRNNWHNKSYITVGFWYNLVGDIEGLLRRFNVALYRNPVVFADQLFYGFYAVFTINCLIKYAESEQCSKEVKLAIQLLFGEERSV